MLYNGVVVAAFLPLRALRALFYDGAFGSCLKVMRKLINSLMARTGGVSSRRGDHPRA